MTVSHSGLHNYANCVYRHFLILFVQFIHFGEKQNLVNSAFEAATILVTIASEKNIWY